MLASFFCAEATARLMSTTLNNIEPIFKLHHDALDLQQLLRDTLLVPLSLPQKKIYLLAPPFAAQLGRSRDQIFVLCFCVSRSIYWWALFYLDSHTRLTPFQ